MLFLLPLTLAVWDLKYSSVPVCVIAAFAAVQEGHMIRTGKYAGIMGAKAFAPQHHVINKYMIMHMKRDEQ